MHKTRLMCGGADNPRVPLPFVPPPPRPGVSLSQHVADRNDPHGTLRLVKQVRVVQVLPVEVETFNEGDLVVVLSTGAAYYVDSDDGSKFLSRAPLVVDGEVDIEKLSPGVRASLALADSSLQQHQSLAAYVNGGAYDSGSRKILLKHDDVTVAEIPADAFVKDGMVSSVAISNGNLVITFNTDAGASPISIPLAGIFNPSNYYDKTAADAKFVAQVSGKGLSTEDYTAAEKAKLAGVAAGAQVNVIETVKVNGTALTPENKAVNVVVPAGTAANKDVPASGNASTTQVVMGDDTRLSDARTPTAHKSSHAKNGSDALTPSDIGAVAANAAITGATKCKVTYDAKGLVTSGANLAASDIPTLPTEKLSDFGTEVRYGHYEDNTSTIMQLQDRSINNVSLRATPYIGDWQWSDGMDSDHGQPFWNPSSDTWELPQSSDLIDKQYLSVTDTSSGSPGEYSDSVAVFFTDTLQGSGIDLSTYIADNGVWFIGPDGNTYMDGSYANVDFYYGGVSGTISYGPNASYATYSAPYRTPSDVRNPSVVDNGTKLRLEIDKDGGETYQTVDLLILSDDGTNILYAGYDSGGDLIYGSAVSDGSGGVSSVFSSFVTDGGLVDIDVSMDLYAYRDVYFDQSVAEFTFPELPSGTTGVRDFLMRLEVEDLSDLTYGYVPIAWPYDVVFETADGEMPDLSAQGTYLLSFTETKPASGNDPAVFALSCKELTEATQS